MKLSSIVSNIEYFGLYSQPSKISTDYSKSVNRIYTSQDSLYLFEIYMSFLWQVILPSIESELFQTNIKANNFLLTTQAMRRSKQIHVISFYNWALTIIIFTWTHFVVVIDKWRGEKKRLSKNFSADTECQNDLPYHNNDERIFIVYILYFFFHYSIDE